MVSGEDPEYKQGTRPDEEAREASIFRPNMILVNGNATSSTFANANFSHSILTQSSFFNSRLHQSNFEGAAFDDADFDGATFTGCSFRGVEMVNCDVERLTINGINVGALLRLLQGTAEGL